MLNTSYPSIKQWGLSAKLHDNYESNK